MFCHFLSDKESSCVFLTKGNINILFCRFRHLDLDASLWECTIPRLKTPRLRQSDSFQLVPTTNGPSPKQSVTQLDWVIIGLKVN